MYLLFDSRATEFSLEDPSCHWIALWNSNFYFKMLPALMTAKPLKHQSTTKPLNSSETPEQLQY